MTPSACKLLVPADFSQSLLFSIFDMPTLSTFYNSQLGDVYEASTQLLVANGLHDAYDIRLTHKHFDIADGEQVVGFGGRDVMLGAVCKNGEVPVDLLHKHGIQPLPSGVFTPSDYFISDKGETIPYEFVYTATTVGAGLAYAPVKRITLRVSSSYPLDNLTVMPAYLWESGRDPEFSYDYQSYV
ncbi:hypothetical protein B0T26DRAFT_675397 [Lasiosphaeria miniovina]|uniref:Uncharacterized protein n=1 Tax=Lasiosphaeria miniovina TaxID=1954250 RepID=A0AA40AJL3_9PEZI|nr:uncharacterized protein B0T26DRAFT_675397 [Lasiosphaeria miniovina]KAK0717014.1 hypothetical protein B0T26DRAFT_675397 [Lasiosphaeria miniovina]